jgi:hypothetical protein
VAGFDPTPPTLLLSTFAFSQTTFCSNKAQASIFMALHYNAEIHITDRQNVDKMTENVYFFWFLPTAP